MAGSAAIGIEVPPTLLARADEVIEWDGARPDQKGTEMAERRLPEKPCVRGKHKGVRGRV